jgi:hypothetical protein
VILSSLPFYLSSWLTPGWLVGANTLVQNFVVRDLHGTAGQIHKTPYLAGIFTGTAVLVALRWIFVVLPCTFQRSLRRKAYHSDIPYASNYECGIWVGFCDGHVLFRTSCRLRSRIYSSSSGYFRAKEDCRGTCYSRRI